MEPPVLSCPFPSVSAVNDKGKNISTVSWSFSFTDNSLSENEPQIDNNSFTVKLKIDDKNVDTTLPKLLKIGESKVAYYVTDAKGNSNNCTFHVYVRGKSVNKVDTRWLT